MALDVDALRIHKQDHAYEIHMTFEVAAPVERVIANLTDFEHLDRLNPSVTKREIISRQNGITRVGTQFRSCVLFYCRDLTLTQDVTIAANMIRADIVPDGSDFQSGYMRWLVSSGDDGVSHIDFKAVVEPNFFIPPLIGGFFVRKALREQLLATAGNLGLEPVRGPASITDSN